VRNLRGARNEAPTLARTRRYAGAVGLVKVFRRWPRAAHQDLDEVARAVAERARRMLRRRGLVAEPSHESIESKPIDAALDGCREAARSRGHIERIDDRGSSRPPLFPDQARATDAQCTRAERRAERGPGHRTT
jgi:hypothetical protein